MITPLQAVEKVINLIAEVESDPSFLYRRTFLRCQVAETLGFIQEKSKALELLKRIQEDISTNEMLKREASIVLAKIALASNDLILFQEAISKADSLSPDNKGYMLRICVTEYLKVCEKLVGSTPLDEIKQRLPMALSIADRIEDDLNKHLAYSAVLSFYDIVAKAYRSTEFLDKASKIYQEIALLEKNILFILDESIELASLYNHFGNINDGLSLLKRQLRAVQKLESSLPFSKTPRKKSSRRKEDPESILFKQQEIIMSYAKLSKAFLLFQEYERWHSCIDRAWRVQGRINSVFTEILVEKGCEIYISTFEGIQGTPQIPSEHLESVISLNRSNLDAIQKMLQNLQETPIHVWGSLLLVSKALLASKDESLARKLSLPPSYPVSDQAIADASKFYLDLASYSRDLTYLDPFLGITSKLDPLGVYLVDINCELAEGFSQFGLTLRDATLINRAVAFLNDIAPDHEYRLNCVNSWLQIATIVFQFS